MLYRVAIIIYQDHQNVKQYTLLVSSMTSLCLFKFTLKLVRKPLCDELFDTYVVKKVAEHLDHNPFIRSLLIFATAD